MFFCVFFICVFKKLENWGGVCVYDSGYGATNVSGTIRWRSDGRFGCAITLTRSTGAWDFHMGDVSWIDSLTTFTTSFWFNTGDLTSNRSMIGKAQNGGTQNSFVIRKSSTAGEIDFCIASATNDYCGNRFTTTGFGLTTQVWYHVTMVYDGSQSAANRVKVYKNGVSLGGSITGTIPTSMTSGTPSYLAIGGQGGGNTATLVASYDEVKFFTSALTADEVKVEYNRGSSQAFGVLSDTSSLTGGTTASSSAEAAHCVPGDSSTCRSPVGYWRFDERSGSSVADISGNGNNMTWNGTLGSQWKTGKLGQAGFFNRTNNYAVTSGDPASLQITGAITISAWINTNRTHVNQDIVTKAGNNGNYGYWFFFADLADKAILELDSDGTGGGIKVTSNTSLLANTWYHVAATYSPSTEMKMYINGVLDATNTTSIPASIFDSTQNTEIGSQNGATGTNFFSGKIDDVKIYNYIRTPAQIAWDYNQGKPVAHYKFDECSGTTAYNSAKNANGTAAGMNGTISAGSGGDNTSVGTCSSGTGTEMWNNGTTGKFNASLDFDGDATAANSDRVEIADNDSLDFVDGSDFTVQAWVNRGSFTTDDTAIAKKNDQTTGAGYLIYIDDANDDVNFVVADATDSFSVNGLTAITSAGWHHIVAVYDDDSAAGTTIYVDGKPDEQSESGTLANVNSLANALSLQIAGESDEGEAFDGQIDDVRIYNYALTANQIKTLYNNSAVNFGD